VFTIVEAPSAGWTSLRTTASVLAVLALGAAFIAAEQRAPHPLIRLGILRSASLRRANLGAMAVAGGWFAFQFVGTLYLQQLRGWSAIEMAVAFLPAGLLVAFGAPRSGELVDRFGTTRVTAVGMAAFVGAYALFLPIGADSPYLTAMLPTMLLAGIGFMCAFGPLNVAATNGIADHEQGLASGLVQTSFQLGGAVGLAVATAVIGAGTTHSASAPGSAAAMLDGFHPALLVSLTVAALGLLVTIGGVLPAALRSLAAGHARPATEDVR
jgi:predicted MFS family arabinose efflux permease